jgi:ribosomal protein L37AE/L43A
MNKNYWLLLEKSDDTRISQGIDGYQDHTGEAYQYDSLVPNHKNLAEGDFVVLRKENEILGIGSISKIAEDGDAKIHRRCPECHSTDIRERSKKRPRWKCGKCAHEFSEPEETIAEVRSYVAAIEGFSKLNAPPSVRDVKRCAVSGNGEASQLSMLQLDAVKIQTLLEGVTPSPSSRGPAPGAEGQGFGLSHAERKAVELHAMRKARELYESRGWKVVDKSSSQPFDLLATNEEQKRFIEVKGTTGKGLSVILTHGEVKHVSNNKRTSALVIVSGIVLSRDNGSWSASAGTVTTHEDPWKIDDTSLKATQYRYEV